MSCSSHFVDFTQELQDAAGQDTDSWFMQATLPGDPYPEGEVCRSVDLLALEPASLLPFGVDAWAGDAYGPGGFLSGMKPGRDPLPKDVGAAFGGVVPEQPLKFDRAAAGVAFDGRAGGQPRPEGFTFEHKPPQVPADPFFSLMITTLRICTSSPFYVGNVLLDFVHAQAGVSLLKVNHSKFSIKVKVLGGGDPCTAKFRIYEDIAGGAAQQQSSQHTLMVEAQRRMGDVVTFVRLFQDLAAYLSSRCTVIEGLPHGFQPPPPPPPSLDSLGVDLPPPEPEDVQPLFNLAARAGELPAPQRTELAAALSRAVKDAQMAPLVCNPQGLEALAKLLQAGREEEEVLYPAAEALHSLALQQDAQPLFVSHGAFHLILDALQSPAAGECSRLALSAALRESVQRFGGALPEEEARTVEHRLREVALRPDVQDTRALVNFRAASSELDAQFQTSGRQPGLYS